MQRTVERIEPCQARITVVVPESRLDRAKHDAAQALGRNLKIPGYRPGHIPVRAVVARLGEDVVREEAMDRLMREVATAAIRAEELVPSAPANVTIKEREPFTVEAVVPLQPEVELGAYRSNLDVPEREPEPVTEDDVDAVLEQARSDLAYLEPQDRPAEADDVVTVELVGRLDDHVVFEDDSLTLRLSEDGAKSAHVPTAVADALADHGQDETFGFSVTYPDVWPQPELQGETVTFEATLRQIAELHLPALDDAFAQQVSDVDTLEELRDRVRATLEARAIQDAREAQVEAALEALIEMATIAYPPQLLEAEIAEMLADLKSRVEAQGFRWERWLELQNKSQDDLWDEVEPEARMRLERRLALHGFILAEDIEVDPDEVEAVVERTRSAASPKERRKLPEPGELKEQVANRLLSDRTLGRLLAIAEGEARAVHKPETGVLVPGREPDDASASQVLVP